MMTNHPKKRKQDATCKENKPKVVKRSKAEESVNIDLKDPNDKDTKVGWLLYAQHSWQSRRG